jgi:hypothetical protein
LSLAQVRLFWIGTHGASKCWWISGIISLVTCGLWGASRLAWVANIINTMAGIFADLATEASFCLAGEQVSYLDMFRYLGRVVLVQWFRLHENEGNIMIASCCVRFVLFGLFLGVLALCHCVEGENCK